MRLLQSRSIEDAGSNYPALPHSLSRSILEETGGEGRNHTLTFDSFQKRKSLTSTQILKASKAIRRSCQFQAILHYPGTILQLSLQYLFTIPLLEILLGAT